MLLKFSLSQYVGTVGKPATIQLSNTIATASQTFSFGGTEKEVGYAS